MRRAGFERMMEQILEELPEEFAEKIENVEFVVEARPDAATREEMKLDRRTMLLGLYQGVPLRDRSPTGYGHVLPDRIVIYQEAVEEVAGNAPRVRAVLKRTLLHEIAHYFGISDRRLRTLGVY